MSLEKYLPQRRMPLLAIILCIAGLIGTTAVFAVTTADTTEPQVVIAPVVPSTVAAGQSFILDGSATTCPTGLTCSYAWSVFGPGFSRTGTPLRQQPGLGSTAAGIMWTDPALGPISKIPVISFQLGQTGFFQFSLVVTKRTGQRLVQSRSATVGVVVQ